MSFFRARRNNRFAPPTRRARFRFDALEARDVPAALSGHVWFDQNNDGVRDPNETPLANVPMTLTGTEAGTNNPVVLQATTDLNGKYQFTGLNQGTYYVFVGSVPNYRVGKASAGASGGTVTPDGVSNIPLPGGEQESGGYNIGMVPPHPRGPESNLSGLVWFDENNDGVRDPSEQAPANVRVALTGPGDTGEPVTVYATTNVWGEYRFTALKARYYSVKVGSVPGYQPGKVSAGVFGGTVSGDTVSQIYVPAMFQNSGGYNFPLVEPGPPQPPGNTLSGLAYHDLDNDGTRDLNEKSLANVPVTLTGTEAGTNSPVQRAATTDANGIYRFTGLNQGTYSVQVGAVAGYASGKSSAGVFGGTPLTGTVSGIPLPGGWAAWGGYNFGLVEETVPPTPQGPGNKISGLLWADANDDGVRDLSERSLPGIELALLGTEVGTGKTIFLTARTDINGIYRFTGLKAGSYSIMTGRVQNQQGFLGGKTSVGAFGGTPLTGGIGSINLPGGWAESGGYNIGML